MKLNVKKVVAAEAERKAKPAPLPKFKPRAVVREQLTVKSETKVELEIIKQLPANNQQLTELNYEMRSLSVERKKLSNQTGPLITEAYNRIKASEGEAVANEFMNGGFAAHEIRTHYSNIQAITEKMMALYDKIKHVEEFGEMPVEETNKLIPEEQSGDAARIKHEIRRLDDFIYKKSNNLKKASSGIKKPKNSDRVNTWKTSIALAEAKRDDLKLKLKALRYAGIST